MELRQVRYLMEHRYLPGMFYEYKQGFIAAMIQEGRNMPYEIISDLCKKEGMELPYEEADYSIRLHRRAEDACMVELSMPMPESEPLCRKEYFVFDKDFQKLGCYTVERGQEEACFLCGWDAQGSHLNYGQCPEEEQQIVDKIWELYQG